MKKLAGFLAAVLSCLCCFVGCSGDEKKAGEMYVYMPDGAPALSMAKLMSEDKKDDGVTYRVVEASTISTYLTNEDEAKNADLCVLPLNAASKLLGSGERYRAVGVVTHGNLYMLSTQETQYTRENLSELIGKTVGVAQLANVPGIVFKVILSDLDIPFAVIQNGDTPSADKVNLVAVTPDMVLPNSSGIDVFVAPEPAASVKVSKTALEFVGDLQRLYGVGKGYPQAVLVAKSELFETKADFLTDLATEMTLGVEWLESAELATICNAVSSHLTKGLTPSFNVNNLSRQAIENSGVRFEYAIGYKTEINGFLQKMIAVGGAASVVQDKFFGL